MNITQGFLKHAAVPTIIATSLLQAHQAEAQTIIEGTAIVGNSNFARGLDIGEAVTIRLKADDTSGEFSARITADSFEITNDLFIFEQTADQLDIDSSSFVYVVLTEDSLAGPLPTFPNITGTFFNARYNFAPEDAPATPETILTGLVDGSITQTHQGILATDNGNFIHLADFTLPSEYSVIPEPASAALLLAGVGPLVMRRRSHEQALRVG